MSEYTTIYLRNKATPLLEYKEHPSWNEFKDLSDDEINKGNYIQSYSLKPLKGCKFSN